MWGHLNRMSHTASARLVLVTLSVIFSLSCESPFDLSQGGTPMGYVVVWPFDANPRLHLFYGKPPRILRTAEGAGWRLTVARDSPTGDFLWIHGSPSEGWIAERLSRQLEAKTTRSDLEVLATAPPDFYAIPAAFRASFTCGGEYLAVYVHTLASRTGEPPVRGILLLTASDLSYHGFVPGSFSPGPMVAVHDECYFWALGYPSSHSDSAYLYEVDPARSALVDSVLLPQYSHLIGALEDGRLLLSMLDAVALYDVKAGRVHRAASFPFRVRVAGYLAERGWLLVASGGTLHALDVETFGVIQSLAVTSDTTWQVIESMGALERSRYLFATSGRMTRDPVIGAHSVLHLVDLDTWEVVVSMELDGHGAVIGTQR